MVLESWGREVGLVLIMDTPRPDQVRAGQPAAAAATEADAMELMEMILGALGGWGWRRHCEIGIAGREGTARAEKREEGRDR